MKGIVMNERSATLNDVTNVPSLSTIRRAAWCAGPGPAVHCAVAKDLVHRRDEGNARWDVDGVGWEADRIDPRTGVLYKLDFVDSNRIEWDFYARRDAEDGLRGARQPMSSVAREER